MRVQNILLIGGASLVSAIAAPEPAATLFQRQPALDERDLAECSSVAIALLPSLTDIPTPDASLASFIAEQTGLATATNPCAIPAVTGSMADEYSSWISDISTWYVSHTAEFSSLIEACSDVPEIKSQLAIVPEAATVCDSIVWETGSSTADSSASSASSSDKADNGNDASRQTGMGIAAAAVAGLVVLGLY
ncbi:hypothetical protein B0J13DRAFT_553510 [Dactylonectria estremocensis]|uniref:Infection structure specific protein n=1 Tax=Dactylonectria estremocensis TaxID=1079267 RepID=A0A9P9EUI1_9HYPO|nr:hypothetical protein B0J13DRAFT_553510 [Dactylonectria estremocensis]